MDIQIQPKSEVENKKYKHIMDAIKILLLTMVVIVTGFILIINKNTENMADIVSARDTRMSGLIKEMGELQEQIEKISLNEDTIAGLYTQLDTTRSQVENLNQNVIESIKEKEKNWEAVQGELSVTQSQLSVLLAEKDNVIRDLKNKNEILNKELSLPPLDPGIVNILVVGHNSQLADTIILASIVPSSNKIVLVSIPRDLYYNGRKINALYSLYGITELQRAVNEVTGVYPDKYVVFNFNSFIDIINFFGGIQIDVPKKLVDNAYPGPDNSYITVEFEKGLQTMDGDQALKYARSRKSTSDFARGERQQQIISAVKESVINLDLLYKMDLVTKLYAKIQSEIKTNIGMFDGLSILQNSKNYELSGGNVLNTQNYLYSSKTSNGSYILLPAGGNYLDIKIHIRDLLK